MKTLSIPPLPHSIVSSIQTQGKSTHTHLSFSVHERRGRQAAE